jgi:hypothetical protein
MATTPSLGRLLVAAALLALAAGGAPAGEAQSREARKAREPYALIFGTVWDSGGRPVPGVPVKIRPAGQTKAKWSLVSDRRGEFAQRLPAGQAEYVVWAELPRRRGQEPPRPEVRVSIEKDERVDISLHLKP